MHKRLLLHEKDKKQKVKEIAIFENSQKLKMILSRLSWKILVTLSEKEMYPLEIAKRLGIHEQKVYYHMRKLVKAGAVAVVREEKKKGATAKYYTAISPAFGIELPDGYKTLQTLPFVYINEPIRKFFREFIAQDGSFQGKIVVGSPAPHGPFRTSARDGHYASHLTFFLGQFVRVPEEFVIKLDIDIKAEKEERNNLILVGGPGTNLLAQELNDCLPVRFNMGPSEQGFLFGGLVSKRTRAVYTADEAGLVAKIRNPWDSTKKVIVLAGNKAVGTKACVLALTSFWKTTLQNYKDDDAFAAVIQGLDLDGDGKVDSTEVLE